MTTRTRLLCPASPLDVRGLEIRQTLHTTACVLSETTLMLWLTPATAGTPEKSSLAKLTEWPLSDSEGAGGGGVCLGTSEERRSAAGLPQGAAHGARGAPDGVLVPSRVS